MLSPNFYRICSFFIEQMFDLASLFAAVLILFLTWYIGSVLVSRRRNYPPGPFPLPIVGNLFLILFRFPKSYKLAKMLQKNYGPIASLYFGFGSSKPGVIVLSGSETIQDAMNANYPQTSNPIIDRPNYRRKTAGLIYANFDTARHERRWIAKIMKNFCAFDGSAVSKIDEELDDFLDLVDLNRHQPWNPRRQIMLSIGAVTHNLLFGRRPTPRETATYLSDMATLTEKFNDRTFFQSFVLPFIPFLRRFFSAEAELSAIQKIMDTLTRQEIETRRNILLVSEGLAAAEEERHDHHHHPTQIRRRSLSVTPPPSPRISESSTSPSDSFFPPLITDFVAHFLAQEKLGKHLELTEFSCILTDMMIGAMEKVTDQILWALFYLAHMPDEQECLYNEIKMKTKPGDSPGRLNVQLFVRTQAFLNEVYRHSCVMPVAFLYETNHEMTMMKGDYKIPADTPVWYSNYSVNYDRSYWGDPENFRIDRWLLLSPSSSEDEIELVNHSSHMSPFGIGNRACPAENLARLEVFAYIAGLLKNYQVRLAVKSSSGEKTTAFNKDRVRCTRKIPDKVEFIFNKRHQIVIDGNEDDEAEKTTSPIAPEPFDG